MKYIHPKERYIHGTKQRNIRKNRKITVKFKYTNGKLKTQNNESVKGFSFTDLEGHELQTQAEISSESEVSVQIPPNADTSKIGFAMNNIADIAHANLCGGTDLPVPAFEIPIE